jgi:hypothetical protein
LYPKCGRVERSYNAVEMSRQWAKRMVLGCALLAAACGGVERSQSARVYRLSDRDALTLRLPADWQDGVQPVPGESFPSIFLAPPGAETGGIVLTVMASSAPGSSGLTEEQLRQTVEDGAIEMTEPSLVEVRGGGVRGWLATENAAGQPPDSYGVVQVGGLVVSVAVQGGLEMRDRAVALLETAAHETAPEP